MEPNFPNEIWLEVFSHLDYCSLKCCMRVSKAFQAFTRNAAFDRKLFRSQTVIPATGNISLATIETHPAFDMISFECSTKIEWACFYSLSSLDHIEYPLTTTSAAAEFASSPPVARLRFQIHDWPAVEVKNKSGVTVLQVMKALCRFFAKKEDGDFTRRDAMGDHTGWTGWDETVLDQNGRLLLRAMWFDS